MSRKKCSLHYFFLSCILTLCGSNSPARSVRKTLKQLQEARKKGLSEKCTELRITREMSSAAVEVPSLAHTRKYDRLIIVHVLCKLYNYNSYPFSLLYFNKITYTHSTAITVEQNEDRSIRKQSRTQCRKRAEQRLIANSRRSTLVPMPQANKLVDH